jgi:hypothetical protein
VPSMACPPFLNLRCKEYHHGCASAISGICCDGYCTSAFAFLGSGVDKKATSGNDGTTSLFRQTAKCGYTASWLRHMLRAITAVDAPASWRAGDAPRRGTPGGRSHDSWAYGKRFMLRLDVPTRGCWSVCPSTSTSPGLRLAASASPRGCQRMFRRAGSRRCRHTVPHSPASRVGPQRVGVEAVETRLEAIRRSTA